MSYGQKALYYWWYLDAQVTNGGFAQFYSNGYGHYIPAIINGLEYVGDTAMANLVKKAEKVYQKNKKYIDGNEFGFDSDDKIDEISFFDDQYFDMNHQTMSLIETYIRRNPNEICLDENGNDFNMSFSGLYSSYFDDKRIKNEYNLELGVIHGAFKSYYQNGNQKEITHYLNGKLTGEREEFYESGIIKYKVEKDSSEDLLIHTWYYENGNPKKLESKLAQKNKRRGTYKEWFENGQLLKSGMYLTEFNPGGKWQEFYQNGQKRLEAEYIGSEYQLKNFWNKEGQQTLKNGTGYCEIENQISEDKHTLDISEYKDYKRHGVQKSYINGILVYSQVMNNGEQDGTSRTYYINGNLEREIVYNNGRLVSNKRFRKFENPKVKTTIISRLCKKCYENQDEYVFPDNDPLPINATKLASTFEPSVSIFNAYGDDYTLSASCLVWVDKDGKVQKVKMTGGENLLITNQIETNLKNMEFKVALKDGNAIESIHFVQHQFILVE
ncbi:MAG: DUF4375 domain-containing protein [Saprospiraceae bacterium]|nr:DUF4375 domain-containing protein [Saprospiraceae bacterium]